jgi:hypothetical protein
MHGYLDFFVDGSGFFLFLLQQSFGLIQLGLRDGVLFLQLCDLLLAFDCSFLELKLFFIKIKTLQITAGQEYRYGMVFKSHISLPFG